MADIVHAKQILKTLKDLDKKSKTTNITFRMKNDLLKQFKMVCKKNGIRPNQVFEELVRQFIEGTSS